MFKKKVVSIIMAAILVLGFSVSSLAITNTQNGDISLMRMRYIASGDANLYIDKDGNTSIYCSVFCYDSVTYSEISTDLQIYGNDYWYTLKTFSNSDNSQSCTVSESTMVDPGIYRIVTTMTVYTPTDSETKTIISSKSSYQLASRKAI